MKKLFWIIPMLALVVILASCEGKKKQQPAEPKAEKAELVLERVYNTDRQYMFTNWGKNYRWFESCVLLKEFLDEECTGEIAGISNVFQAIQETETGADVHVVLFAHTPDTSSIEVVHSFWVEDYPLNDEKIEVTFKEAFDKVMAVNYPKPHSKHVVLRKEVGPVDCNPQYIFGNTHAQLYVDAVTGDVKDTNPAFPEDKGFKMPLGEWP